MSRIIYVFAFCILWFSTHAQNSITGKIEKVIDGNTLFIIDQDQDLIKVKLKGIDCPELEQELGLDARDFTCQLVSGKEVSLILHGKDRWGNEIVDITLEDNLNLSESLLKNGLAWSYSAYKPTTTHLALEQESKESKIGIWQTNDPIAPWVYRRQQSMLEAKVSY